MKLLKIIFEDIALFDKKIEIENDKLTKYKEKLNIINAMNYHFLVIQKKNHGVVLKNLYQKKIIIKLIY